MNKYKKSDPENQYNDEIDLLELFGVLFSARWFIGAVTALFTLIGFLFAFSSAPIFKADALIQLEKQDKGMGIFGMDFNPSLLSASAFSDAEIEILKSRMVLGKTVDEFNLTTLAQANYALFFGERVARLLGSEISIDLRYFHVPENMHAEIYSLIILDNDYYRLQDTDLNLILQGKIGEEVSVGGYRIKVEHVDAKPGDVFTLTQRGFLDAIDWVKNSLRFDERGNKSGIFQITFEGAVPFQNKRLLDNVIKHYLKQNIDRNAEEAQKSLIFLDDSLPEVKKNLTLAEDKLNVFRQKNASINLNLEAKSILGVMVKVEEQLKELVFKENEMDQRYTSSHPLYIALIDNRNILLKEQKRLSSLAHQLPKTQREILRLTRDVEVNQQIYLLLLNKIQELRIVKASTVGNVRILDKAESHSKPLKPNKIITPLLFMMLGFILGVLLSFFKFFYRKGIENTKEIESLGIPVYASIPLSDVQMKLGKIRNNKLGASINGCLLAQECPSDLAVEALRTLRTNVHFLMIKSKNNVLMISGSHSGVGKSFVCANIASVIVKAGLNVLLIDADMRKGTIEQYYGLRHEAGLSELLAKKNETSKLTFQDAIKPTCTENLSLLTRGSVPPNPSELLFRPRFGELIRWASDEYDLVIIDTPPILAVTDASIIGAHAGMSVLVARFSLTKLKELEVALERFATAGIDVDGFILNGIEPRMNNDYAVNYSYKYQ